MKILKLPSAVKEGLVLPVAKPRLLKVRSPTCYQTRLDHDPYLIDVYENFAHFFSERVNLVTHDYTKTK